MDDTNNYYEVLLVPKPQSIIVRAASEKEAEQKAMDEYDLEFEDVAITPVNQVKV